MKKMNSEKYWAKRIKEREETWHKKTKEQIEKEIRAYYKQALSHITDDINALYARFAVDNELSMKDAKELIQGDEYTAWRMDLADYMKEYQKTQDKELWREINTLAMRSRITRLEKLHLETMVELSKLAEKTQKTLDRHLAAAYQDFHRRGLFDIGKTKGLPQNITQRHTDNIEKVLRTPWSGKNYSERIWKNKSELNKILKTQITNAIHRGTKTDDMAILLSKKMNVGLNNAKRLLYTELNYVQNQGTLDSLKDAEFEYYRFVATLDERTSTQCRNLDGKIYEVEKGKAGENMPPLHPRCRSTIVASIYGDIKQENGHRTSKNKDGKRVLVPTGMTYKEWEGKYLKNEYSPKKSRIVTALDGELQYYKQVKKTGEKIQIGKIGVPIINAEKIKNADRNIFISDKVTLKLRKLHEINQRLTDAFALVGTKKGYRKPKIIIIAKEESPNSVAAYRAWDNTMFLVNLSPATEKAVGKQFADGNDPLSTVVHELLHWKDAQLFREKYGDINTREQQEKYIEFIDNRAKRKLDVLKKKGYDVEKEGSKYAKDSFTDEEFDEVYTEYRVWVLLKGGK